MKWLCLFKFRHIILMMIIAISSFTPIHSFSQDWIYVDMDISGNKNYIRSEYISKSSEGIKIWEKILRPKVILNKKVYTNVTENALLLVNCVTKEYSLLQLVKYNNKDDIIYSEDFDNPDWVNVVPESIAEEVLLKVCQLFNK